MMGGGGMGMGNVAPEKVPLLNVPPEKTIKFKVPTVCLEHGKPEPRAAMQYKIEPIESFTDKPEVKELCGMLGQVNQRAAQAAAWHLNNNMTWQQLAAKQLRFANGTTQPYFSPLEIRAAMQIAAVASKLAEQRKQPGASENAATPPAATSAAR
jgi:hypothetical protein